MKMKRLYISLLLLALASTLLPGQAYEKLENYKGVKNVDSKSGTDVPVSFVVIYDNYVFKEGTKADWGFSVLVDGSDKKILFDTGTKPGIFESNLHKIGLDPSGIDLLVVSHEHLDHTGGITALVKMQTGIPVIMPVSLSETFKKRMVNLGLKPVMAEAPSEICRDIYTSGEFDYGIPEAALVIDTKKGLVVLTGCAHPGIVNMLTRIRKDFNKDIYLVCGGFHLMNKSEAETKAIIREMKNLGVEKCGATHCTGTKQIDIFRNSFGENFVELGTGNKVVIE